VGAKVSFFYKNNPFLSFFEKKRGKCSKKALIINNLKFGFKKFNLRFEN
jgi:hypothetical protein